MAGSPTARSELVQTFMDTATQIIHEAAFYTGSGVFDPAVDSEIRKLRVMAQALQAALMSAQVPMPTMSFQPTMAPAGPPPGAPPQAGPKKG